MQRGEIRERIGGGITPDECESAQRRTRRCRKDCQAANTVQRRTRSKREGREAMGEGTELGENSWNPSNEQYVVGLLMSEILHGYVGGERSCRTTD